MASRCMAGPRSTTRSPAGWLPLCGAPARWGLTFPLPKGPVERVLVRVPEEKRHLLDVEGRIRQVLARPLTTRFTHQALEARSFVADPALQRSFAHPQLAGDGPDVEA